MSDCLFCKIVARQIPAKLAHEGKNVEAFHDINPQAPIHLLIIPKKHIGRVTEAQQADQAILGELVLTASEIAKKNGIEDFRLIFNNGAGAGQSVFHIHLHLMAGRKMSWPPG